MLYFVCFHTTHENTHTLSSLIITVQIEIAKKYMREFPGDAFANAFVGVDGVYQTRGYTAMHGAVIMRCIQFWGALLAFHCMSRNHPEDPFVSTSCLMERNQ